MISALTSIYRPWGAAGVSSQSFTTPPLISFIVFSRIIRNAVIAESISSYRCSRLVVLSIPVIMLSNYCHYDVLIYGSNLILSLLIYTTSYNIGLKDSFTPRLVPALLHTEKLLLNTRQEYLINLCLRHLSIPSQIMFKASLTHMP